MAIVSIIIPCYKQAEYLPETLDSVLAQTFKDWECIIVNDGSPDSTECVAKEYCEKDTRFKYVYQSNQGLATSRNNGIKASEGQFILPLDADDIIAPTYIEKAIKHFTQYPETKVVYCKARKFGKINTYWNLPEYNYENLLWTNMIFCSAIYKRVDYDKTCGYNPNMKYGLEDWDFWLSLLHKEDIVHRIDEVLFFYRVKANSMITTLNDNHTLKHEVLSTIASNHLEKYELYCKNIVYYMQMAKKGELYESILNSHSYKLGNFLLTPFIRIKKIIKKKQS